MEREILEGLAVFIIGAPLLGLSIRLALRPLIDAAVRIGVAFESLSSARALPDASRLAQLEEEVQELRDQLRRANEGLEFERRLQRPG